MEREAYLHIGDPGDPKTWLVQVKEMVNGQPKVTPAQLARALTTFKEDVSGLTQKVARALTKKFRSLFSSADCSVPAELREQDGEEDLTEQSADFGEGTKVDRDKGIIHDMCLMKSKSSNGYEYTPNAMKDVARLAEGVQCFLNHSDPKARSIGDLAGQFRDVHFVEQPPAVRGDLKLIGPTGQNEQLMNIAEDAPSAASLSIHAKGRFDRGSRQVTMVAAVKSVDIVAFGATTDGLFEAEGWTSEALASLTADDLLKRNPGVAVEVHRILTVKENTTMDEDDKKTMTELRETRDALQTKVETEKARADTAEAKLLEQRQAEERTTLATATLKEHKHLSAIPVAYRGTLLEALSACSKKEDMVAMIDDRVQLLESAKLTGKGKGVGNPEIDTLLESEKGEGEPKSSYRDAFGLPELKKKE